jgi:hypothetical protein
MIVLDADESWHLVLQTHHADLAGQLAAAWGNNELEPPRSRDSLVTATIRHDDGWAVRDRWPEVHEGDEGRPVSFVEVDIPSHIAFYRAGITDVSERDPYAGLMDAMHGAGLYRRRYDTNPQMGMLPDADQHRQRIEEFIAELEDSYSQRRAELGISEDEQWTNYKLLQIFDRMSLYFCGFLRLRLHDVHVLGPAPVNYAGSETEMRLRAISPFEPFAPHHVRVDPFPFAESPAVFTLERRVLPKQRWTSAEFRREFFAAPTETIEIRVER